MFRKVSYGVSAEEYFFLHTSKYFRALRKWTTHEIRQKCLNLCTQLYILSTISFSEKNPNNNNNNSKVRVSPKLRSSSPAGQWRYCYFQQTHFQGFDFKFLMFENSIKPFRLNIYIQKKLPGLIKPSLSLTSFWSGMSVWSPHWCGIRVEGRRPEQWLKVWLGCRGVAGLVHGHVRLCLFSILFNFLPYLENYDSCSCSLALVSHGLFYYLLRSRQFSH